MMPCSPSSSQRAEIGGKGNQAYERWRAGMRKQMRRGPTTRVRQGKYWTIPVAVALAVAALLLLSDGSSSARAQTTSAVLVGAGDIASCDSTGDTATSKLLGSIAGTVLTIGDNAYKE